MDATTVLLGIAALGANFGWQPDEHDPTAYEVVVQLEPQLLDAMRAGHEVPIDVHVPAGVAPIRKVRVVVGEGDVRRTLIAADADSTSRSAAYPPAEESSAADRRVPASEPIVIRGQEPGWSDERYPANNAANSRRYDQLGPAIGIGPIDSVQAPPPLERAQSAAVETGDALRSGVEAGIQQANQQISRAGGQLREGVDSAGRELGRQFESLAGAGSQSPSTVWAPPPLSTGAASGSSADVARSVAPKISSTAWTSIRSDRAPPRLPIPALTSGELRIASTSGTGLGDGAGLGSGPSIPSTYRDRAPLHSVLADQSLANGPSIPKSSPAAAAPKWADPWLTSPSSAPGAGESNSMPGGEKAIASTDLRAVPPPPGTEVARPANVARVSDDASWPWAETNRSDKPSGSSTALADDRYGQPPAVTKDHADPFSNRDDRPAAPNSQAALPPLIATAQPPPPPVTASADVPWLPLLGTSVCLAGSLAANLFLGWSYADARQKYRVLVRKSTHAFQKSAGVAA